MDQVEKDVVNFKKCMEKYHIDSNDTSCLINPKSKELQVNVDKIFRLLINGKRAQPPLKILAVMMFAGLGVQYEGMQALLYNEFDKKRIKVFKAEAKIRSLADAFPNAFIMCIFACDRSVYNFQRN